MKGDRIFQVYLKKSWVDTSIKDLKPSDRIRIIQDGVLFKDVYGNCLWEVLSYPYIGKDKVYQVDSFPIDNLKTP